MFNFGEIDLTRKTEKPKLFLAKPNKTVIAKLNEAYDINNKLTFGSINSMSFKVPFDIDIRHKITENKHINMLKYRYLIKLALNNKVEWYIITDMDDVGDDDEFTREVKCMSLAYELKDKTIRGYNTEESGPKTCTEVLNDALSQTLWTIGYVDSTFDVIKRSFSVSSKTALDFLNEIAETFKGVIEYDTVNRKVSMRKEENMGTNKGLVFSYDKYIKSINKDMITDDMTTRLKVYGKDDLSINRLNPTGTNYLEDFSYFLYPFQRDSSKKVLKYSDYMSESLCHAILDYNALVATKKGEFDSFVAQKEAKRTEYDAQEIIVSTLEIEKSAIEEIIDVQQAYSTYNNISFTHINSTTRSITMTGAVGGRKHAVIMKADNTSGLTIIYNGSAKTLASNQWVIIAKENLTSNTNRQITINGNTTTNVKIISVEITSNEYAGLDTESNPIPDSTIINKYCLDNKTTQLVSANAQLNSIQAQMDAIDAQISSLRNVIKVENNFTVDQLKERNMFIIEKEWTDQNYVDDKTLYDDAVKRFEKLREPQTLIEIDVVNFLEVVECQRDWSKLNIGDTVTIKYEKFNVNIRAKIIGIDFNHENGEIKIIIANVQDIKNDKDKFIDLLYKSISTSTTVDMNRLKWDRATHDLGVVGQILNEKWNAAKREIVVADNEMVTINQRGITIRDTNDPMRLIRMTHGVIGVSVSGENQFETAIDGQGVIAKKLYGEIILGNNLIIGDASGILQFLGAKGVVTDRNNNEVMKLGLYEGNTPLNEKFGIVLQKYNEVNTVTHKVIMDRDDGFKIQKKSGSSWEDVVWIDTNGQLNLKNIIASGTISTPKLKVANLDINDLIYDATEGLRSQLAWIKGGMIEANTISANQIKTDELIVGTNITMGPNATISWGKVTGAPSFATNSDLANYVTNTALTTKLGQDYIITGKIYANQVTAGTLTGFTIQTATSGARVMMNSTGIYGYNASGETIFSVVDGKATLSGATIINAILNSGTINALDIDTQQLRVSTSPASMCIMNTDGLSFSYGQSSAAIKFSGDYYTSNSGVIKFFGKTIDFNNLAFVNANITAKFA